MARYFEALAQKDWVTAYAQLHPTSKSRLDSAAYQRAAQTYGKQLGFPLGKIQVRSCDEQGEKAIAQLILMDVAGSAKSRYREGVVLQKDGDAWRIVLPANFGAPPR